MGDFHLVQNTECKYQNYQKRLQFRIKSGAKKKGKNDPPRGQ